ncbi:MAG: hypothetical protein HQK60_18795 [Deltaproteobacteria bacterium]|nr:hypothetical protein [Deltaproteobacteria bacterium]
MMMEFVEGCRIDMLPLMLSEVVHLIYLDGPLLSLVKNDHDETYVQFWCDADEQTNRWLIFRITDHQLVGYLTQEVTLYHLVLNPPDGFLYMVDTDPDSNQTGVSFVLPSALPEIYLPPEESYYDVGSQLDDQEKISLFDHLLGGKIPPESPNFPAINHIPDDDAEPSMELDCRAERVTPDRLSHNHNLSQAHYWH